MICVSLLKEIYTTKKEEVSRLQAKSRFLKDNCPSEDRSSVFELAISSKSQSAVSQAKPWPRVIAECKKASPSRGLLRFDYNPEELSLIYKNCGASALSVLTDKKYFQGDLNDIHLASRAGLPILRKDFIIDPLQIYEAKHAGAHAILLIVSMLSTAQLTELYLLATTLGLAVLVEIHNTKEADIALNLKPKIIGINHRDLDTLKMNMELTLELSPSIKKNLPNTILVAESGIEEKSNYLKVENLVDAVLIGTSFMESQNIEKTWSELFA